jgi:prepilin-type processing-associated H-X9-DG protein
MGAMDYIVFHQVRNRFYVANAIPNPSGTADNPGALANGTDTALLAISDGTSNTIMITEAGGRPNHFMLGRDTGGLPPSNEGFGWSDPDTGSGSYDGCNATTGVVNPSSVTAGTGGTCIMNCNNDSEPYSFHSGGINACMADGSVRFIRQSIPAATMAALLTARGGETVVND